MLYLPLPVCLSAHVHLLLLLPVDPPVCLPHCPSVNPPAPCHPPRCAQPFQPHPASFTPMPSTSPCSPSDHALSQPRFVLAHAMPVPSSQLPAFHALIVVHAIRPSSPVPLALRLSSSMPMPSSTPCLATLSSLDPPAHPPVHTPV